MREILKLRAWDIANKEFTYWTMNDLCTWDNKDEKPSPFDEWTEYTGITCNGHEWYEGDIIENDSDWYQITWDDDQARWEATGINSTHESLALSEMISQETWVQGNIYENKDLLS